MSNEKELIAVAEVLQAYFRDLFRETSEKVEVFGKIHDKGLWSGRAIDLGARIKPGGKYKQIEVVGNWVSVDTTSEVEASKQIKELHPDTIYAALYLLIKNKKIRPGGLGYYQLRTKLNSQKFGQPLAAASHRPTYALPKGPFGRNWLWTSYANSKWSKYISASNKGAETHIKGLEKIEYADINSEWYKSAHKKQVKKIEDWVAADILPHHVIQKIAQLNSHKVDWGMGDWNEETEGGWIPTVTQVLIAKA